MTGIVGPPAWQVGGLFKAKEEASDLIISDVMMPEMDGIKMCNLLKENKETSHIPIVLLTAKNAHEARINCVGSAADQYFANRLVLTFYNLLSVIFLNNGRKSRKGMSKITK